MWSSEMMYGQEFRDQRNDLEEDSFADTDRCPFKADFLIHS